MTNTLTKLMIVFLVSMVSLTNAQETSLSADPSLNLFYEDELDFDFRIQKKGLALNFTRGKMKTYYQTHYWRVNIGSLLHEKEYRQSSNLFATSSEPARAFVYGKQNSFYALRMSRGIKRLIGEKARERGVSVSVQGDLGFTLGILKPYYLSLYSDNGSASSQNLEDVRYSGNPNSDFLKNNSIYGASKWTMGWDDPKLRPGVNGSFSSVFDWNAREDLITALEVGVMMDYFFQDVPIMILEKNNRFFVNVYLALRVGKRW